MTILHGGLDLYFTFTPAPGLSVRVLTDILARAYIADPTVTSEGAVSVEVGLEADISVLAVTKIYIGDELVDRSAVPTGLDGATWNEGLLSCRFRVFVYDEYIAVSLNDKWVAAYTFGTFTYPDPVAITLKALGGAITITDILSVELKDGRTAVYVDYEATADNALSSIVQERPIEMYAEQGREASYTYRAIRGTVTPSHIYYYAEHVADPQSAASDALIYYENVSISISELTAKEMGLVTRMYRLSQLETGAIEASKKIQLNSIEQMNMIELSMRLDPRIQRNDLIDIDLVLTGTGRNLVDQIIAQTININMRDGEWMMTVAGRRHKG